MLAPLVTLERQASRLSSSNERLHSSAGQRLVPGPLLGGEARASLEEVLHIKVGDRRVHVVEVGSRLGAAVDRRDVALAALSPRGRLVRVDVIALSKPRDCGSQRGSRVDVSGHRGVGHILLVWGVAIVSSRALKASSLPTDPSGAMSQQCLTTLLYRTELLPAPC